MMTEKKIDERSRLRHSPLWWFRPSRLEIFFTVSKEAAEALVGHRLKGGGVCFS
jgi:hypothetical protein